MKKRKILKFYLPLGIGLAIIAVLVALAPWQRIGHQLATLSFWSLCLLFLGSVVYYGAKTIRFWIMLRILGITAPFRLVALAYLSAQPVSLLPAGEVYRTVTLERIAGVPKSQSAATVTFQGIFEGIFLATGALIGAIMIGRNRFGVLIVFILLAALLAALRWRWFDGMDGWLNKLPYVSVERGQFQRFIKDHQTLLRGRAVFWVGLFTLIPVGAGIFIVHTSATAIGSPLTWSQASIAYCLPVILSGLSMLPGGLGASEGGGIGVLRLLSVTTASAVAITLLTRIFTLGASLVFGLSALAISQLRKSS